ncbi:MAG: aldo/keto reductase [Planctomycetes bacterium]|nr:aldo/keto reductase [Planctomycetota bacterium]
MSTVTRRDFLAGTAFAAGATALAGLSAFAAPAESKGVKGSDLVTLGNTGIKSTILGIGTGTNAGRQQRDLGTDGFTRLVHHAYERGIRYIDTADMYMTHMFVRFALKELPSDEFFIQTKTRARHPEVAKVDIERFRREMDVECLGTLLMHCMTKSGWTTDMRPVMDVLQEAKDKERVRAVGISNHGFDPLAESVDSEWPDVQLVRINPFGVKMDGKPEDVAAKLKKLHAAGRGVIGMKIFGEDGLGTRERRLESLKYVLGLGCVDAFTIGFTSTAQLDETMDLIEEATA